MAYFVAKELNMRPTEILENWTVEELMVSYGYYANQHSAEYLESIPQKEWAKQKPKPLTWLDRWAVLFVSEEQIKEINDDTVKSLEEKDFIEAANLIL